ncbi:DNA/RNA helicase domain-containing protein, partial [Cupriavidus pampae]
RTRPRLIRNPTIDTAQLPSRRIGHDPEIGGHVRRNTHDTTVKRSKDDFVRLVKNTYRVLLSRGMKGCYVYFADPDTADHFRKHLAA